jgi:antitoxin MazE
LQQIQFSEGSETEFSLINGKLVIQLSPLRYSLEELVSRITPENLHNEIL